MTKENVKELAAIHRLKWVEVLSNGKQYLRNRTEHGSILIELTDSAILGENLCLYIIHSELRDFNLEYYALDYGYNDYIKRYYYTFMKGRNQL